MNSRKRVQAKTLKGFRDILPSEALPRRRMMHSLEQVFESYGFAPIETPHLEYTEVLINETGGEIGKQLFRFEDQGGRDVCLRYDLTVPFARFVVQHKNEIGIPFKRYAFGSVFRGERPQFGRYREFTQCDFDMVGTTSISADAEIIQVLLRSMYALGISDFIIKINNRKLMNGICEHLGVQDRSAAVLRALDKLYKIGAAEVKKELCGAEAGLDETRADEFLSFVTLSKDNADDALFQRLTALNINNSDFVRGVEEFQSLYKILHDLPEVKDHLVFDLTVARGFGYYTGTVYETALTACPEVGTVAAGGRYDNLTGNFSDEPLPGVGASIGLDRLLAGLSALNLVPQEATPAPFLLAHMSDDETVFMHQLADRLRSSGIRIELYPEAARLKKQFQYADRRGHKAVLLQGSREREQGIFLLKDLGSGEQKELSSYDTLLVELQNL